jgi:hypothetical protein
MSECDRIFCHLYETRTLQAYWDSWAVWIGGGQTEPEHSWEEILQTNIAISTDPVNAPSPPYCLRDNLISNPSAKGSIVIMDWEPTGIEIPEGATPIPYTDYLPPVLETGWYWWDWNSIVYQGVARYWSTTEHNYYYRYTANITAYHAFLYWKPQRRIISIIPMLAPLALMGSMLFLGGSPARRPKRSLCYFS